MCIRDRRGKLRQTTINKDYLYSVLNSMTDAVFVTSPDGVIKMANSASRRLLGFGEEELIGRSISAMLDERERQGFDLHQAAQQTCETVMRTRNGQTIPVAFTGSQIASEDPQFQGCIFVARNITDRKRAERRIRYLARYDALTKLPNRMQFHHLLQQAIARGLRGGHVVALLYLDMDRFKEVNDTFGHGCGDRLYAEFVLGGVALPIAANGGLQVKYASGVDLLRQTPEFISEVRSKRLDGEFQSAYR